MAATPTQPWLKARIPPQAALNLDAFPCVHEPQTFPNQSLVACWFLILQMVEKNGEDMRGEASRIHLMGETSWNTHRQPLALPFWRRCSKKGFIPGDTLTTRGGRQIRHCLPPQQTSLPWSPRWKHSNAQPNMERQRKPSWKITLSIPCLWGRSRKKWIPLYPQRSKNERKVFFSFCGESLLWCCRHPSFMRSSY